MSNHNDIALFKLPDGEHVSIPSSLAHTSHVDARVSGVVAGIAYFKVPGTRSVHRTYIVQLDEPAASGYSAVSVEATDIELLDEESFDD